MKSEKSESLRGGTPLIRTSGLSYVLGLCSHTQGQGSQLWSSLLLEASISIVWKIIYQKQK